MHSDHGFSVAAGDLFGKRVPEGAFVPRPSVLLVDDSSAILNHVCNLLRGHKQYEIASTTEGTEVFTEYYRLRPDVIVLDISLGAVSGIDIARELRDSGCHSKIVFLTVHEDSDFMNAAMGAGGSAYVVKSRLGTDLIAAIEAVLAGKIFVSPSLLNQRSHA